MVPNSCLDVVICGSIRSPLEGLLAVNVASSLSSLGYIDDIYLSTWSSNDGPAAEMLCAARASPLFTPDEKLAPAASLGGPNLVSGYAQLLQLFAGVRSRRPGNGVLKLRTDFVLRDLKSFCEQVRVFRSSDRVFVKHLSTNNLYDFADPIFYIPNWLLEDFLLPDKETLGELSKRHRVPESIIFSSLFRTVDVDLYRFFLQEKMPDFCARISERWPNILDEDSMALSRYRSLIARHVSLVDRRGSLPASLSEWHSDGSHPGLAPYRNNNFSVSDDSLIRGLPEALLVPEGHDEPDPRQDELVPTSAYFTYEAMGGIRVNGRPLFAEHVWPSPEDVNRLGITGTILHIHQSYNLSGDRELSRALGLLLGASGLPNGVEIAFPDELKTQAQKIQRDYFRAELCEFDVTQDHEHFTT